METAPLGLFHSQGQRQVKRGFAIQIASLNQRENFVRKQADLQSLHLKNILVNYDKCKDGSILYKVFIGPFATTLDATNYQKSLKKKNVTGFIVDLTTF